MANFTFKDGAAGKYLEEKLVTYSDVGLPPPGNAPSIGYSWGYNANGQLGQNNGTYYSSPRQFGGQQYWKKAIPSDAINTMLALSWDGSIWAVGNNANGVYGGGYLGNEVYLHTATVSGQYTDVAFSTFVLAVNQDGSLWSWGNNANGKLGHNNIIYRSSPVQVGTSTDWSQVAANVFMGAAVKTDGTLWTWGANSSGQLGHGNLTTYSSPRQVGTDTNWAQVELGTFHTVALKTDGTLWGWGGNDYGELGDGANVKRSSPVQIGSLTNWSKIAKIHGGEHTVAIKTDGTLWAWGSNSYGQMGHNDVTVYRSPMQVGALTNWQKVSTGDYHVLAIKTDGTLWSWGQNQYGQLGHGNTTLRSSPVQVGFQGDWYDMHAGSGFSTGLRKIY